jgi:hypothetical protein
MLRILAIRLSSLGAYREEPAQFRDVTHQFPGVKCAVVIVEFEVWLRSLYRVPPAENFKKATYSVTLAPGGLQLKCHLAEHVEDVRVRVVKLDELLLERGAGFVFRVRRPR